MADALERAHKLDGEVKKLEALLRRAESDRDAYARQVLEAQREQAYAIVHADLKRFGVTKVLISKHVVTAERKAADGTVERCPCPTLFMTVEGLGIPEQEAATHDGTAQAEAAPEVEAG